MSTSSLSKEMLRYFTQLNDAEQKSVLQMIKTFLSTRSIESKPQSLEEYNRELEEADLRIEGGRYITQDDLEKEMKTW
ncbi:MAG TPA: hypothetical protein VFE32_13150 [Puia sp.]|jgi:hypothetical protein|nr:hypothetical protein [Puia sp.]